MARRARSARQGPRAGMAFRASRRRANDCAVRAGRSESGMTFSSKAYWDQRGKVYEKQARDGGWWDGEQEHLPDLLAKLRFSSVLEVGCGFGRVGASIKRRWPEVEYTGMDISADLVEGAQK